MIPEGDVKVSIGTDVFVQKFDNNGTFRNEEDEGEVPGEGSEGWGGSDESVYCIQHSLL